MRAFASVTLLSTLLAAPAAFGGSASDDFTRPDANNPGPDWMVGYGNSGIENNKGKGLSGAFTKGWMSHTGFTGNYVDSVQTIDFATTGSGQAIFLCSGFDSNSWGGVAVSIRDNTGDGKCDRLFFEPAFNAGQWTGGVSSKYDLMNPTDAGSMTVYFTNNGDTVVCEIDTGAGIETASQSGVLSLPFPITGSEFAIGHMGPMTFDNWEVVVDDLSYGDGCPGSGGFTPTLKTNDTPMAGGPLNLVIADALGGETALLMFGLGKVSAPIGNGACTLLIGPVFGPQLYLPIGGAGAGNGVVNLPGNLPGGTSGLTFTMQAFCSDPGSVNGYTATNGLEIIVP